MLPLATNLKIIKTAWATYAIIGLNTAIHVVISWETNFIISDKITHRFGFVPASISSLNVSAIPTLVTSIFLHGDLFHLFGNMIFLFVFGRRLENQLEKLSFSALYLSAGTAACLVHALMVPDSTAPLIGASGAISGVLGGFFICNPRARVTLVLDPVLIYFLCRLCVRVPAWIFLPVWFFLQVWMGLKQHETHVAFWAHVGGFLAGGIVALAVYQHISKENFYPTRTTHSR